MGKGDFAFIGTGEVPCGNYSERLRSGVGIKVSCNMDLRVSTMGIWKFKRLFLLLLFLLQGRRGLRSI